MQGLLLDPNAPVTPEIPEVAQPTPMAGDPNAMPPEGAMPQPDGGMMGAGSPGEALMDQQMSAPAPTPTPMGEGSTLDGLLGQSAI